MKMVILDQDGNLSPVRERGEPENNILEYADGADSAEALHKA